MNSSIEVVGDSSIYYGRGIPVLTWIIIFLGCLLLLLIIPKTATFLKRSIPLFDIKLFRTYLTMLFGTFILLFIFWYVNAHIIYLPYSLYPFSLLLLVFTVFFGIRIGGLTGIMLSPFFLFYLFENAIITRDYLASIEFANAAVALLLGFLVGAIIRSYMLSMGLALREVRELQWKTRQRLALKAKDENILKTVYMTSLSLESHGSTLKTVYKTIAEQSAKLIKSPYIVLICRDSSGDFSIVAQYGTLKVRLKNGKAINQTMQGKAAKSLQRITLAKVGDKQSKSIIDIPENAFRVDAGFGNVPMRGIIAPVHAGKLSVYVVAVRNPQDDQFTIRDKEKMRLFAAQASMAVKNAQSNEETTELIKARDQFASAISHELKTPLSVIKLYAQMLGESKSIEGNDTVVKGLETIDGEVDKLTTLINQIHDFAKFESGRIVIDRKAFSVEDLARDQIETMKLLYPTHTFSLKVAPGSYSIEADRLRLEQVLINLLKNAVRYSDDGKNIELKLEDKDKGVRIQVKDEGIGMTEEVMAQIFEPFYRAKESTKHSAKGLGLGLYITQQIIALHKGKISVKSTHGKGSTFTVELPKK